MIPCKVIQRSCSIFRLFKLRSTMWFPHLNSITLKAKRLYRVLPCLPFSSPWQMCKGSSASLKLHRKPHVRCSRTFFGFRLMDLGAAESTAQGLYRDCTIMTITLKPPTAAFFLTALCGVSLGHYRPFAEKIWPLWISGLGF